MKGHVVFPCKSIVQLSTYLAYRPREAIASLRPFLYTLSFIMYVESWP